MKKFFTLALFACLSMFAMAQTWEEGEEITDQVNWGNLKFENDPMDFWTWTGTTGSTTQVGGLFENYNGSNAELFQVIQLPAGMYKVTCQGYYRCGNSWADDPNAFFGNNWTDRAWIFAANGTYDITSSEFAEGHVFKKPLMPRLYEGVTEQLYAADQETIDAMGWDPTDGFYNESIYGPTSVPGTLVWFNAGWYQPDDEGKYNAATFFLKEDGYVKVGIMNGEAKTEDSFCVTNFKLFYLGEPNEAMLALQELDEVFGELLTLQDKCLAENNTLLYALIDDELINVDYDEDDVESVNEAIVYLTEKVAIFSQALEDAKTLSTLVASIESLLATTSYSGAEVLQGKLQEAKDLLVIDNPDLVSGPDVFANGLADLRKARIDYMMTSEMVDGAWNFSGVITTPFFCDDQYTPQWNAENNRYEFPLQELEDTWANIQETGYNDVLNNEGSGDNYHPDWLPICNNVVINDGKEVENQWMIHSTTWHGGAIGITMQHSYPAIGGWTAEPTNDPELLYQIITNLPDGFYSMSALMCNAGADISPLQYVYITAGDQTEKAPLTQKGDPWWGWGKDQWRQTVWQKLTTGMVQVTDGRLTIGSSSDAFYAATGFQLYYYGTNPNYKAMIQSQYDEIYNNFELACLEGSLWKGDSVAIKAMFAEIPEEMPDFETYSAAGAKLKEIDSYMNTAKSTIANFCGNNGAPAKYLGLMEQFADNTDKFEIVNKAIDVVIEVGTGDNDTYKDAVTAENIYNAYVSYFRTYDKALTFNNSVLNEKLADQTAYLKANYGSVEKLDELEKALLAVINAAIFAERGADKASEGNPIDITDFLVNASLETSPNEGWLNEPSNIVPGINTYGRKSAEIWDANPFDIYQVVKNLPEGAYEFRVRACYRDAGDVGSVTGGPYYNWFVAAGENPELWEQHNAQIYASCGETDNFHYVKSVCDGQWTEPSYDTWYNMFSNKEEYSNYVSEDWSSTLCIFYDELTDLDKEEEEYITKNVMDLDAPAYPFDSRVQDGDNVYYYPCSMSGFYWRTEKSPEAYNNSVQIMVPQGGDLRVGLRKNLKIGGDWLIYRNFELYYLGKDVPSSVNSVDVKPASSELYNIAGQKVDASYKGLVIKNGKKYFRFK